MLDYLNHGPVLKIRIVVAKRDNSLGKTNHSDEK